MAINQVISDRILDPYGRNIYSEDTVYSNILLSSEANRLLEVVDNDSVLSGCNLNSFTLTNNNRSISVQISTGRLVQSWALVDILEPVDLELDIFGEYSIAAVDTSNNSFSISGNYVSDFEILSQFAVVNSTGNNSNYYTVSSVSHDSGTDKTIISVADNVTNSTADGKIITRKYLDSHATSGVVVIFSDYQYLETTSKDVEQDFKIKMDYIDSDGIVDDGWESYKNTIVFGIINFTRDSSNIEIEAGSLEEVGNINTYSVNGIDYQIRRVTSLVDLADGEVIN